MDLPTGTVTFLFTDIEGSTRLWEQHGDVMARALARHDAILRQAIASHGGHVFKTMGDAVCAAFADAAEAVAAALAAQRALRAEAWHEGAELRVRMALHTGAVEEREGDYLGPPLNRVARLRSAAHGGQTLLSRATYELVRERLPQGAGLADLGEHSLRDLSHPERIFQLCHPDLPADFPRLRSLQAFTHNLPLQLTSFIGREQEIEDVQQLLADTRLLTLTGVGGAGKTRLALQVAAELLEEYEDGVWLTELAPLADPELVPQTVASALGVREQPGRSMAETLTDHLRSKSCLLILDNCEHLLDACARLAEELLRSCPDLKALASSREGLGIPGERTYHVLSLSVPRRVDEVTSDTAAAYDSVRLFRDRAQSHQPSFELTGANAGGVAQICRRLDGIPLAIELAAARVRAMPVEQIAQRLDDRFRLLTGGSRTALPRQQTLQALIDWSHDLLSDQEKTLLRRLSVFSGGFTLRAAEAVCSGQGLEESEVLGLLTSLVGKSMAVYEEQEGEARYRVLETVRQYARDRLAETTEGASLRERHRDWFLALAERAKPELLGPEQKPWMERLGREHDNMRAALQWARSAGNGEEAGLRLAGALGQFWQMRGHWREGREHLQEMLALSDATERTPARAGALIATGDLASCQGDYEAARGFHEEALAINRETGNRSWEAANLNSLGIVAKEQGDYAAARALYEESLAIRRQLGDSRGVAGTLQNLGLVAQQQGDYAAARALYEQSLAIQRQLGDSRGVAGSLNNMGIVAKHQGDYAAARALYEEALAINREIGNRFWEAANLDGLGSVAERQGDYAAARALYEEALAINREIGNRSWEAVNLNGLGNVDRAQGAYAGAWALYEEALAINRDIGDRSSEAENLTNLAIVAREQGQYAAARALHEEGLAIRRQLGHNAGVASSLKQLGMVVRHQGEYGAARALLEDSLVALRGLGKKGELAECLEALAALCADETDPPRAARLLGAAGALRETIGAPLPPSERAEHERSMATARDALGEEAFEAAWAEGRAMTMEEAVAYALGESDTVEANGNEADSDA